MNKSLSRFLFLITALLITSPFTTCHAEFTLRGWGGGAWVSDSNHDYDAKHNPGYAVGIACGGTWFRLLRTDIEVLRFHNTLSHIKVDSVRTDLKGDLTATAGLFNVQLHCPLNISQMCVSPYFGGGVGGGSVKTKLHGKGLPKINDTRNHSIYQFFAGLSTVICPLLIGDISLEIEGRYLIFDKHLRAAMAVGGLTIKF